MKREEKIAASLRSIEQEMRDIGLWSEFQPDNAAFNSTQPFSIDTMAAEEWLQWIFIPRLLQLLEMETELPSSLMIAPYFEEALKYDNARFALLLSHLRALDELFKQRAK